MLELEFVLRSQYAFRPKVVAQAITGIAALGNIVLGERAAILSASAKSAQGWDFADSNCLNSFPRLFAVNVSTALRLASLMSCST